MADASRNAGQLKRIIFPFTAMVGQENMKLALLLNAINPRIGGVLIRGEKGTGKSTVVRALADLLPDVPVVDGCAFHCDPNQPAALCPNCAAKYRGGGPGALPNVKQRTRVVDLPLGATEDRVLGTLDLESAIKLGERVLDPGILAAANQGIVYIDEINLLDDHVIDVLLDATTSGVNVVQREGICFSHPARFILVGTMNPEEGELRPQLLDRIALHVSVSGLPNVSQRVQIITRRNEFEENPLAFTRKFHRRNVALKGRLVRARRLLSQVDIPAKLLLLICRITREVKAEGQRPDIMMARTARTLAAYNGRTLVTEADIKKAAEFVLPFRVRANPFQEDKYAEPDYMQDLIDQLQNDQAFDTPPEREEKKKELTEETEEIPTAVFRVGAPLELPRDLVRRRADKTIRAGSGERIKSLSTGRKGRYIKHRIPEDVPQDIAFDATIRAAAPYQLARRGKHQGETGKPSILIADGDLRNKVREDRVSTLIVLAVDASGSMGVMQRMEATKGVVLSLLMDAYQRRDRVAVVAFRGRDAVTVLPPTSSVERARRMLTLLPTGGKTPLSAGLMKAYHTIKVERKKDPTFIPIMVLLTDGRANVPMVDGGDPMDEVSKMAELVRAEGIYPIIIDTEVTPEAGKYGSFIYEYAQDIAKDLGGVYYKLKDLSALSLGSLIQMEKGRLLGGA